MAQETQHEEGAQPAAAEIFAEPDGTLVIRFRPQLRLTGEQTAAVTRAVTELAGGQKRPVLSDARGLLTVDHASREMGVSPAVIAFTSCMAVVVGNPATRIIGRFFLKVTTPPYPTRIFADEAEARVWLKQQVLHAERAP